MKIEPNILEYFNTISRELQSDLFSAYKLHLGDILQICFCLYSYYLSIISTISEIQCRILNDWIICTQDCTYCINMNIGPS
jgi:hypothetical protein